MNAYGLWEEPSHCNFGGRIENKRLGDGTQDLASNDKGEVCANQAPECCSNRGEYCSYNNTFLDASHIEYPVGRKVDEDVDDHVAHRNN